MLTLKRSKIVCLGKEAFCISYNTTRQKSQECFSLRIFLNELFFIVKGESQMLIETPPFLNVYPIYSCWKRNFKHAFSTSWTVSLKGITPVNGAIETGAFSVMPCCVRT